MMGNPIEAYLRDHVTICRDLLKGDQTRISMVTLFKHFETLSDRYGDDGLRRIEDRARALAREIFGRDSPPPLANMNVDPLSVVEADMIAESLAKEARNNGVIPCSTTEWPSKREALNQRFSALITRHVEQLKTRSAVRRIPEPAKIEALIAAAVDRAVSARLQVRMGPGGPLPPMHYPGVWKEGASYVPGDVVTYRGTIWHCGLPTQSKPGTDHSWQMMAKSERERDSA